jgi:hypothetical protein
VVRNPDGSETQAALMTLVVRTTTSEDGPTGPSPTFASWRRFDGSRVEVMEGDERR